MEYAAVATLTAGIGGLIFKMVGPKDDPLQDPAHRRKIDQIREQARREIEKIEHQHRSIMAEIKTKEVILHQEIDLITEMREKVHSNNSLADEVNKFVT
jgi:hypothetical protein